MTFGERTVSKNYVYRGKILNVRCDDAQLPDGKPCKREVVEHGGGAAVLYEQDGKIFTLDNRRLYAFKQAGMSQINVRWVNPSAPNIVRELAWKFTTINGGRSIRLR